MSFGRKDSVDEPSESPFTLYGCGRSTEGQLGLAGSDDMENVVHLAPISSIAFKGKVVVEVSSGSQHSLMRFDDGGLLTCGNNDDGQLGRSGQSRWKPGIVTHLQGLKVIQVACGVSHSLALVDDGHVFAWGSNAFGQLGLTHSDGNHSSVRMASEPREINMSKVVQIACGSNHTLTLSADGAMHAWGDNRFGQIGVGRGTPCFYQPKLVQSLVGIPFKGIVGGGGHSFALSVSGAVFGWGSNRYGQLGVGDMDDRYFPVQVKALRSQLVERIACGDDFTAALTKESRLFTFGCGSYGQLGHGSVNHETLPKQVFELMGSNVRQVACGRCHTLVIVNDKLYSFGLAGSGQLGIGHDTRRNRLAPFVVKTSVPIKRAFAGGDQSFALGLSQPTSTYSLPDSVPQLPTRLTATWVSATMRNPQLLYEGLETIFSNASCLNCSFLKPNDEHYGAGIRNCGVAMDELMETCETLSNAPNADQILRIMKNSITSRLLSQLSNNPPDVESLRLYVILPWCPVFSKTELFESIHYPFSQRMNSFSANVWKIIEQWWRGFSTRHVNRVLKVFKQVVPAVLSLPPVETNSVHQRSAETTRRNSILKSCLDILLRLNKINVETRKLSFDAFYINDLAEKVDVRAAYCRWLLGTEESEFSFCNYPFVFNAAVKTMLLQTDSMVQMQMLVNETNRWNFEALFNPRQQMANPFFELRVSRANIVEDTVAQVLSTSSPYDLKKPLKISFKGEEAVDEGGVKKEFFLILFQELLHPKYGMFVEEAESHLLWFTSCPFDEPTMFQLVGILVGLAVHNMVLAPMPFPLALYKKLLDHPVTLDDLKELCPTEGRSLESILEYDESDFEDVFDLTFTINVSIYGHVQSVELKPDGESVSVTKENRQEYVDLYVDHKLNKQVQMPFDAFAKGIRPVLSRHIMQFFQPQELQEMVAGNEIFDWAEFEKNTAYHGEYWVKHPTVRMFWDVFHSLSDGEKKKFLLFLTGCARVPLLGMKELKMQIQPTGGGDSYFPAAHTCYNLLDLPKYSNAKVLKQRLLEAIEHNQGFSLV